MFDFLCLVRNVKGELMGKFILDTVGLAIIALAAVAIIITVIEKFQKKN